MAIFNHKLTILLIFTISVQEIISINEEPSHTSHTSKQLDETSSPLASLQNEIGVVSHNGDRTKDTLRVKRQYYDYDPYYRRRPIPIIIGGGGFYGGRGFGGRGFGGRGFGGRGFGGRGFGGRGFGGRGGGFGGFGGRAGGFGGGGRGGRG